MKNLTTNSIFFKMTALAVTAIVFSILLVSFIQKGKENIPLASSITIDTEITEQDFLCTYSSGDKIAKG